LPSVGQTAFFVGDGLQRAAIDAVFNLFTPSTWAPTNVYRLGVSFFKGLSALFHVLSPQHASLAWQELKNKIDVFTLVKNLDARLGLKTDQFTPLPELVEKAYSVSSWEALWAVEGTGHYYTDQYWNKYGEPHGLFFEENAPVPVKSLTMLHAGLGLSIADRLLDKLTTESTAEEVSDALEIFVTQCRNNSRKGYMGAAIESLGLVTRDFHPDLLKIISRQFRIVAPDLVSYFWRGAGRALYYSRKYFTPVLYSLWDGVEEFEGATETERSGALAGRVWASTLVNMRHPAIMENMLRTYNRGTGLVEAFANGVASCMTMRQDITPNEQFVIDFYNHQPSGDANFKSLWNRCVGTPARSAVETYQPVLSQIPALEEVFHYQDLDKLTQELKAQKTAN
jgi:hypothetical protein